jgi:hypothetical protein
MIQLALGSYANPHSRAELYPVRNDPSGGVFFDNTVPILISIREREQEQDPRKQIYCRLVEQTREKYEAAARKYKRRRKGKLVLIAFVRL